MTFGERLMDLGKSRGLSQEELGGMIDVTRQTVSKWERDESTPDLDRLVELAGVFEFEISLTSWLAWSAVVTVRKQKQSLKINQDMLHGAGTLSTRAARRSSVCRLYI